MKLSKTSSGPATPIHQPDRQSALLLIDLQNDFFPGGTMEIPKADSLIPTINAYIRHFSRQAWPILATRDWHPPNHTSFTEQHGPYPSHCIQGSHGAQIHSAIVMPPGTMVISKGTDAKTDSQSGFDGSSLADRLEDLEITKLFILGPASNDAVKHTVLDARKLDWQVVVLADAIGQPHSSDGSSPTALQDMMNAGANRATITDLGIDLS